MSATDTQQAQQQWFTTPEAAKYCRSSHNALLKAIQRGALQPDGWGGRGGFSAHRFHRDTLDRFMRGE